MAVAHHHYRGRGHDNLNSSSMIVDMSSRRPVLMTETETLITR